MTNTSSNRSYPPLGRCLQTLEVLIKAGDVQAIGLAENAVDEFLGHEDDTKRKTGHLHIRELEKNWKEARGKNLEFLTLVLDYVASRYRTLQD